ncbi:MAG: hypothetical protein AAGA31_19890, partial [Bacteroidota bacterium]
MDGVLTLSEEKIIFLALLLVGVVCTLSGMLHKAGKSSEWTFRNKLVRENIILGLILIGVASYFYFHNISYPDGVVVPES